MLEPDFAYWTYILKAEELARRKQVWAKSRRHPDYSAI